MNFPKEIWLLILQFKKEIELKEGLYDQVTPMKNKKINELRKIVLRTKGGYHARLDFVGKWAKEYWLSRGRLDEDLINTISTLGSLLTHNPPERESPLGVVDRALPFNTGPVGTSSGSLPVIECYETIESHTIENYYKKPMLWTTHIRSMPRKNKF